MMDSELGVTSCRVGEVAASTNRLGAARHQVGEREDTSTLWWVVGAVAVLVLGAIVVTSLRENAAVEARMAALRAVRQEDEKQELRKQEAALAALANWRTQEAFVTQ